MCRSKRPTKTTSAIYLNALTCSAGIAHSLPRLTTFVGQNFVPNPSHLQVIPDTGAEVTITGTKYLSHLKIKQSWLNPPQHNLKHVAGGKISVIGSCYLSFNVHSQTTIEEVYFVDNIPHIFLSLIACNELKLISSDSPYKPVEQAVDTEEQEDPDTSFLNEGIDGGQPGITQLISSTMGKLNDKWETNQQCSFQPISIPEKLPYDAVDQNTPLLEKWLLENFSSVFNAEKYPLAVMSGKLHHIHLQENTVPTATHSPNRFLYTGRKM